MSEIGGLRSGKFNHLETTSNVYLRAESNNEQSIYLHADGGTQESIIIRSDQGTSRSTSATTNASIQLISDVGGIGIRSHNVSDSSTGASIYIHAESSSAEGQIKIHAENDEGDDAIYLLADSAPTGGIKLEAVGKILLSAGSELAESIYLHANSHVNETIKIHCDQGTGVGTSASIYTLSDDGGITFNSQLSAAQAIYLKADNTAGGIDVDIGTNGLDLDTTGQVALTSTKNAADSIYLHANGGISETIKIHSDQGNGTNSINILSDVGGITLNGSTGITLTGNVTVTNAIQGLFSGIYTTLINLVADSSTTYSYKTYQVFTSVTGNGVSATIKIIDCSVGDIIFIIETDDAEVGISINGLEQNETLDQGTKGIFLITELGDADGMIQFNYP